MQTLPEKAHESETVEVRLAKVGAQIDHLIARAEKAKEKVDAKVSVLREKKEEATKRSEAALDEMKVALDKAWHELNEAWEEIREGGERATHHLLPRPKDVAPCSGECQKHEEEAQ